MINHSGVFVSDEKRSIAFYKELLAPFGWALHIEVDPSLGAPSPDEPPRGNMNMKYVITERIYLFGPPAVGMIVGRGPKPQFGISLTRPGSKTNSFWGFEVPHKQSNVVDSFFKAGLSAGGKAGDPPALRDGPTGGQVYSASVFDPDGNELECTTWMVMPASFEKAARSQA